MYMSSVSYRVLVNREEIGPIFPKRGHRQGDPLSPYLFILCAEGLSGLIKRAESRGLINGCIIHQGAPTISPLLFTNDNWYIFKASRQECSVMNSILHQYSYGISQAINRQKLGIFFSSNVSNNVRHDIIQDLSVFAPLNTGRYLGFPSLIRQNKKVIFSFLKDRLWHRLSGWYIKLLSQVSKEVLLKNVA